MALNVRQLNSDASFLLTLEPIVPDYARGAVVPKPFTILLDPWITGPSTVFHSRISTTTHKRPACISSLSELPEPDLVIISQHKTDHCNEATLRQLPPKETKTIILAEPASARLIRSWKYFERDKVQTLEQWEDPRLTEKQTVFRVAIPALAHGGKIGEVTIAFVPQRRDRAGVHNAICITYRPPATSNLPILPLVPTVSTPPTTPTHPTTAVVGQSPPTNSNNTFLLPPSPPVSPTAPDAMSTNPAGSLRAVRSAAALMSSPASSRTMRSSYQRNPRPGSSHSASTAAARAQPLSIIFSPHGISYTDLAPYATSHLVQEAALPLTALLHCMDSVSNPWWLGGDICSGAPSGAEIAARLGAKVWISAHDGDKDVRGLATGLLKFKHWDGEELEKAIGSSTGEDENKRRSRNMDLTRKGSIGTQMTSSTSSARAPAKTETMRLNSGDDVLITNEGLIWRERGPSLDHAVAGDHSDLDQGSSYTHTKPGLRYEQTQTPDKSIPLRSPTSRFSEKSLRLRTKTSMSALSRRLRV